MDLAIFEMVTLRSMILTKSKDKLLNFTRLNFQLFKDLVNEILWETVLKD